MIDNEVHCVLAVTIEECRDVLKETMRLRIAPSIKAEYSVAQPVKL